MRRRHSSSPTGSPGLADETASSSSSLSSGSSSLSGSTHACGRGSDTGASPWLTAASIPVNTACADARRRLLAASRCTARLSVASSLSSTAGIPGSTSGSDGYMSRC